MRRAAQPIRDRAAIVWSASARRRAMSPGEPFSMSAADAEARFRVLAVSRALARRKRRAACSGCHCPRRRDSMAIGRRARSSGRSGCEEWRACARGFAGASRPSTFLHRPGVTLRALRPAPRRRVRLSRRGDPSLLEADLSRPGFSVRAVDKRRPRDQLPSGRARARRGAHGRAGETDTAPS